MIMLANLGTGEPASGQGYELDAIAAADAMRSVPTELLELCFSGVVKDVSYEGNHPVYKYTKPIFWEVKR